MIPVWPFTTVAAARFFLWYSTLPLRRPCLPLGSLSSRSIKDRQLTPGMQSYNKAMSAVRVSVDRDAGTGGGGGQGGQLPPLPFVKGGRGGQKVPFRFLTNHFSDFPLLIQ